MNLSLESLLGESDVEQLDGQPFLITTSRRPSVSAEAEAKALSQAVGQRYVDRSAGSLAKLYAQATAEGQSVTGILTVHDDAYTFWLPNGATFIYHPGMAVHRVKALDDGRSDPLVRAMDLHEGDSVLDCTAGLCSDALVASYAVGASGRVRALESSLPVAVVVGRGLATYEGERLYILPALRRIELRPARAEEYLRSLPTQSWDAVYFDPMFHAPLEASAGISPLRHIANPQPLLPETLTAAARVARRVVVVKDRRDGPWFNDPRFSATLSGSGKIGYAILSGDALARVAAEGWVRV